MTRSDAVDDRPAPAAGDGLDEAAQVAAGAAPLPGGPLPEPSLAGAAVVQLPGDPGPAEVARLLLRASALLLAGAPTLVCEVAGRVGLGAVDLLARLAVLARRHAADVEVRDATGDLADLLALAGLAGLVRVVRSRPGG